MEINIGEEDVVHLAKNESRQAEIAAGDGSER